MTSFTFPSVTKRENLGRKFTNAGSGPLIGDIGGAAA